MAPPRALLGILTIALALLAGCTQPNPMGEPTYTCTPTDGTTPYPCYKVQYDAKAKEDALYTEAETVYRKFFAEEERIYRAGGVTEPTPVLLETTTGAYRASVMAVYSDLARYKASAVGGTFTLAWLRRVPTEGRAGIAAALQTCVDSSTVTMKAAGEKPAPGGIGSEIIYFARENGTLKAADLQPMEVTKC